MAPFRLFRGSDQVPEHTPAYPGLWPVPNCPLAHPSSLGYSGSVRLGWTVGGIQARGIDEVAGGTAAPTGSSSYRRIDPEFYAELPTTLNRCQELDHGTEKSLEPRRMGGPNALPQDTTGGPECPILINFDVGRRRCQSRLKCCKYYSTEGGWLQGKAGQGFLVGAVCSPQTRRAQNPPPRCDVPTTPPLRPL